MTIGDLVTNILSVNVGTLGMFAFKFFVIFVSGCFLLCIPIALFWIVGFSVFGFKQIFGIKTKSKYNDNTGMTLKERNKRLKSYLLSR